MNHPRQIPTYPLNRINPINPIKKHGQIKKSSCFKSFATSQRIIPLDISQSKKILHIHCQSHSRFKSEFFFLKWHGIAMNKIYKLFLECIHSRIQTSVLDLI